MSVHDAGDIAWADLDPVRGAEQGERRPALVMTSRRYNELSGRAVICPITSSGSDWPFNVPLPGGLKTRGVVLVDQVHAVHRASRVFRRIETAPAQLMLDVRLMLAMILGIDVSIMPRLSGDA
ncbi:endoribonuclease MazF [soil metagenome]